MSIVIRDTAAALGLEGAAQLRPTPQGSVSYLLTLQKKKKSVRVRVRIQVGAKNEKNKKSPTALEIPL